MNTAGQPNPLRKPRISPALALILHWGGNARSWDDRHRLALINAPLSLFLILTPLATNGRYPSMYCSNPIILVLLWWVAHKVKQRVKSELQTSAMAASPSGLAS